MLTASAFRTARRVFVFGPTGLLGHHTVHELLTSNATVSGLVRPDSPATDLLPIPTQRFHPMRGDLLDRDRTIRVLAASDPDVILHLATASNRHDEAVFAASRVATPDTPVVVAVSAEQPRRSETLLRYAEQYNRRVLIGRLPKLFGEGDRNGGWLRSNYRASATELGHECLYAGDAARGIVQLAELAIDTNIPNRLDLQITARPALTIADILAATGGQAPRPRLHSERAGGTHLADLTDWSPTTPLDEAVRRTIDWANRHSQHASQISHRAAA